MSGGSNVIQAARLLPAELKAASERSSLVKVVLPTSPICTLQILGVPSPEGLKRSSARSISMLQSKEGEMTQADLSALASELDRQARFNLREAERAASNSPAYSMILPVVAFGAGVFGLAALIGLLAAV